MTKSFDVIVIGAGPAGYVTAIRCAQLGLKTACVDNWLDANKQPSLGGTCLNVGCIPSKALLDSSSLFGKSQDGFTEHGVKTNGVELDLTAMMTRKNKIVTQLTKGISSLFKANHVTSIAGQGQLCTQNKVKVSIPGKKKTEQYNAKHIVLAPGSCPLDIPAAPLQQPYVVDSTGALVFDSVPKRLGIIGAGAIGLELGSVWRRLGSEVVLLEAQDSFLTMVDEQIAHEAQGIFIKQGLDIRLHARVIACEVKSEQVHIRYQDEDGEQSEVVDRLIVAVGRQPNTEGIASEDAGLVLDEWGLIHVDEFCSTSVPGVYAIGDAVRGPMLAHKGSEEGIMVAERIAGQHTTVNYDIIPSVIYTDPEIAWAGKTEQELKTAGVEYRLGRFPFAASGRARTAGDTIGMVKVLADASTDRILGVHMLGAHCSEQIAQAVVAMSFDSSSEDIALTVFAHPTLSEAFHEAALDVSGSAIHIAKSKN